LAQYHPISHQYRPISPNINQILPQ
jgi:hypothetical protein